MFRAGGRLPDRQRVLEVRVRARDHVDRHQLAHPLRRRRTGVGRRLHRRDVAADDGRHVPGADLLLADELTLAAFTIASAADHRDQTLGLDHSECLTHLNCLILRGLRPAGPPYRRRSRGPHALLRSGGARPVGASFFSS